MNAIRGLILLSIGQALKVVLQLLSVAVLSRLLSPDEFGVVAAASPFVAFVFVFQDLGFQAAIVQRKDLSPDLTGRMFWTTGALGVVCTAVCVAVSPLPAMLYDEPRVLGVVVVSALPISLSAILGLHVSLLNRSHRYMNIALVEVGNAALQILSTAVLATWGFSYWSLPLGNGTAVLAMLTLAWAFTRLSVGRPRLLKDASALSFGWNLTGFGLVNFVARNLDNVLIGAVHGTGPLGAYDRAYKLLVSPIANISQPLGRIALPAMSRLQDDLPRLRREYLKSATLMVLAVAPALAAAAVTSVDVVNLVFGPKWDAVAPILAWLAIAGVIQPLHNTTGWIFIAQGKTRPMFLWGLYASSTTVISFVVGLPWGPVGVAMAYAISDYVVRMPVLWWLIRRIGPIKAGDLLAVQWPVILAFGVAWVTVPFIEGLDGWQRILLATAACYLFSGIGLLVTPISRTALLDWFCHDPVDGHK